jgi:phosphoribosylaminoimidazolecarboxamide formyltransferase/IMP cyclohydrolase
VALTPLDKLPENPLPIKRALLSVSDKTGIVELATALHRQDVEIISTGGTARTLSEAGIPVKDVSEVTGSPEILDGRVKTLHPIIHGGILGRSSYDPDLEQMKNLGIEAIELVVVNLYPFADTIAGGDASLAKATEFIDIGGPTMVRAAAKNFAHVCILSNPGQYEDFILQLEKNEGIEFEMRKQLAAEAFNHTAAYDAQIANYFSSLSGERIPEQINISLRKNHSLRYGENPHQSAGVFGKQDQIIDCFHGKQLSYNNYLDVDAGLNIIRDFLSDDPACVIIKHTVPCGVALADKPVEAYQKAFETDKVSPFGGIVVFNRELDLQTAEAVDKIFTEIIIAPAFSEDASRFLQQKQNRRLIRFQANKLTDTKLSYRSIFGGMLVQESDLPALAESEFKVVSKRKPTENEMNDLRFAWKVVKHVKSNAIVYARDGQTLGIGTGQTSRVDSSEIAIMKADKEGLELRGSAIASDAFFPFADGVEAAAKAGVRCVIQPGGSIRDEEVIAMADQYELAMIFTGTRHFKH